MLVQYFNQNYIKVKYGDKALMQQTNTDSVMCKIEVENASEDFHKDKDLYVFSDYAKTYKYFKKCK